jgi:beta-N-acetylhexosaminidase
MKTYIAKRLAVFLLGTVLFMGAGLQSAKPFLSGAHSDPEEDRWVDSVFNAMSGDQRLGQLFMIRAHSDLGADHIAKVEQLIRKYQVGSLCFFQGTPEKQVELINRYQQLSATVPLMIAIDGEWGLGMRMKESTISFPRQLTLGAIQDNKLLYDMGVEIARQMRRVGVHVNFAPVADVNNNPENPVINTRSFGEDRYNVAVKSFMYMKGMQDNGVMACAKHFPGHGDTDVDSHYDLPVINHDRQRLDSIELLPFRMLAQNGIGSMMIAHLHVPALDNRANRPTTLSRYTVTTLLKEQLGFEGIAFTDALEMKGVTKHHQSGEVEAEALLAGNDVLVLPEDMETAIREIKKYISDGRIPQKQVDDSVRKILRAKHRLGLTQFTPIPVENVRKDLNSPESYAIKQKLFENAMTLVRNHEDLIPFQEPEVLKLAAISIGASALTPFQKRLESFRKMDFLQVEKEITPQRQKQLIAQFQDRDAVIVGLHNMSGFARNDFGLTRSSLEFLEALRQKTRVVLVVFGNPYSLKYFDNFDWVLEAYEEDAMAQDAAAQALFGGISVQGRLPVTASEKSAFNTGVLTRKNYRLGYSLPEGVGLSSEKLSKIDRIAKEAIAGGATPGCAILVAKDGKIVYNKVFGHHTYDKKREVKEDDLYDLASVTKIAAATIAVMKLQDEGLLDIDRPLAEYLPELEGSNKGNLALREILAHRAGLEGWIPFYRQTVSGGKRDPQPMPAFYSKQNKEQFDIPVTENLYLRNDFTDSIWQQIIHSSLGPASYKYSDLGFYLIAKLVERISGCTLDQYVEETFYRPMGLQTATYLPWQKFPIERIVPTEKDNYFRRQTVQGYVHDMGAAMLGGISGHAGLFANARDVAAIMQMLLQSGRYDDRQYINPQTVREFCTRYAGDTRRGLGFDMRQLNPAKSANLSRYASPATFGHLGFTGTATWADPENNIVYVFLCNRTYPSKNNNKLSRLGIRGRIQSAVYQALIEQKPTAITAIPGDEITDSDD